MIHRLCPVCHRPVEPTRKRNIGGHLDKAGNPCPASYEVPFEHTIATRPQPRKRAHQ